jgi:hypothetical protein
MIELRFYIGAEFLPLGLDNPPLVVLAIHLQEGDVDTVFKEYITFYGLGGVCRYSHYTKDKTLYNICTDHVHPPQFLADNLQNP